MESKKHKLRYGSYDELLLRNLDKLEIIKRIKNNIIEVLSILMNGYAITGISHYCRLSSKRTVSKYVYYDYLHMIEPILRAVAERSCQNYFQDTMKKIIIKVGFEASWGHRRNAENCIGIMIDLNSGKIIGFHVVHHGKEENTTMTSTLKHAKNMESISLFKIIDYLHLDQLENICFVHDCDLTDEKVI